MQAPQIDSSPVDLTVLSGSSPSFTCTASGTPLPTISWQRGSGAISSGGQFTITESSDGSGVSSTLAVSNVQLSDAGTYSCSASNSEGTVSSSFTLTVECKW